MKRKDSGFSKKEERKISSFKEKGKLKLNISYQLKVTSRILVLEQEYFQLVKPQEKFLLEKEKIQGYMDFQEDGLKNTKNGILAQREN